MVPVMRGKLASRTKRNKARASFRHVPSKWQTSLQCNAVYHWLGPNLESYLILVMYRSYGNWNGDGGSVRDKKSISRGWTDTFNKPLQWRHDGHDGVFKSPASPLFTQPLIHVQFKENTKAPRHWPLCGNSPVTGEFTAQRASNTENVSIWWRHHGYRVRLSLLLRIHVCHACIDIFQGLNKYTYVRNLKTL